jgi:hypothetical protein
VRFLVVTFAIAVAVRRVSVRTSKNR